MAANVCGDLAVIRMVMGGDVCRMPGEGVNLVVQAMGELVAGGVTIDALVRTVSPRGLSGLWLEIGWTWGSGESIDARISTAEGGRLRLQGRSGDYDDKAWHESRPVGGLPTAVVSVIGMYPIAYMHQDVMIWLLARKYGRGVELYRGMRHLLERMDAGGMRDAIYGAIKSAGGDGASLREG